MACADSFTYATSRRLRKTLYVDTPGVLSFGQLYAAESEPSHLAIHTLEVARVSSDSTHKLNTRRPVNSKTHPQALVMCR
jgi:hypothetical protein